MKAINQFYRLYIKTLDAPIRWLLYTSLIYLLLYVAVFIHIPAIFSGAPEIGAVLSNVAVAVITGVLVYVLTSHKTEIDKAEKDRLFLIGRLEELKRNIAGILFYSFQKYLNFSQEELRIINEEELSAINFELLNNNELWINFGHECKEIEVNIEYFIMQINSMRITDEELYKVLKNTKFYIKSLSDWYKRHNEGEVFNIPFTEPNDLCVLYHSIDSLTAKRK